MKKFKLIFLLIVAVFIGCKKETLTSKSIVGEWELRTAINGITGVPVNYLSGNGTILIFTKNTYESYSGGNLIKSGNYKIVKDVSVVSKEVVDRILYDNEYNSVKFFFKIESNKLSIWADGYDAPGNIYEKK